MTSVMVGSSICHNYIYILYTCICMLISMYLLRINFHEKICGAGYNYIAQAMNLIESQWELKPQLNSDAVIMYVHM